MPSSTVSRTAARDHGVGDVGDVKFVEAQQPGLVEDCVGCQLDHVAVCNFTARDVLAIGVDLLMRLGHEFVEMGAALVLDRALLKEQIHQHGLAAADLAMNVKPPRRRLALVAEQAAKQA